MKGQATALRDNSVQMRPPGTNLGQREVRGSKVEGHEHVLLLGIPKSISPWKGAVSELTEPVALFLREPARLALTSASQIGTNLHLLVLETHRLD